MKSAYLGSFLAHGTLFGLCAWAASFTLPSPDVASPEGHTGDVTLVDVGGGSPAPGPGSRVKPVDVRAPEALDARALLAAIAKNRADEARLAAQHAVRPEPRATLQKPVSVPSSRPVAATPRAPAGIVGARVGDLSSSRSPASAASGSAGVPRGLPGDGAAGESSWVSVVRSAFAETFIPLFREHGGDLRASRDTAEVELLVSPSGKVSFSRWAVRPKEALMESLVTRAVDAMAAVPPPADGLPKRVLLPVSAHVLD